MPLSDSTTITHRHSVEPEVDGNEALIIAFPKVGAIPVPGPEKVVGRAWLADAGAADDEVSRNQLVFERHRGELRVRDAGSRNGTWVDGVPIGTAATRLESGSLIRCGRTLMVYRPRLLGGFRPSPPRGKLVAPYGLRGVERDVQKTVSRAERCVLLEGPTGAGKELVAEWVAQATGRRRGLTKLNVSAIPENVFESHLFGHVKGAFTGADTAHLGVLRASEGGVVFLDEIGSLPLSLQPKLLRFLDSFEVQPVGSSRTNKVDLVVIAATNVPLQELASFRPDLAWRLGMSVIRVPSLSERSEDVYSILRALSPVEHADVEAVEALMRRDWPGNVRELAGVLHEIANRAGAGKLPLWAVREVLGPERKTGVTRQDAEAALELAGGNQSEAARKLGIARVKLRRLLGMG